MLFYAYGDYFPTGTGSYHYSANYKILVDNIAYEKLVGVWGRNSITEAWGFFPGSYSESLPGNKEIWLLNSGTTIDQFVVKYEVNGDTYWDNNNWNNYALQPTGDTKMIGNPNVILGGAHISNNKLNVTIGVKNLAYHKEVGIVYTTNGWATFHTAYASYDKSHLPSDHYGQIQAESWKLKISIGTARSAEFAIFYNVNGQTYWDNNFGRNYSVSRS